MQTPYTNYVGRRKGNRIRPIHLIGAGLTAAALVVVGLKVVDHANNISHQSMPSQIAAEDCGETFMITRPYDITDNHMLHLRDEGRFKSYTSFMDARQTLYIQNDDGKWVKWERDNYRPGDKFCIPSRYLR